MTTAPRLANPNRGATSATVIVVPPWNKGLFIKESRCLWNIKKPKNVSSQKSVIFYQSDESSGASPQEGGGEEEGGGQQGRRQQQDGERPHLKVGGSYDNI